MKKFAIIVAAGTGSRFESALPKQFHPILDKPMLMYSIEAFALADPAIKIILVLNQNHIEFWKNICKEHQFNVRHSVVLGGSTRIESVKNGLSQVDVNSLVAVHDGARPLITTKLINECFEATLIKGNAVVAIKCKDSLRKTEQSGSVAVNRSEYSLIQTPQCFKSNILLNAYEQTINNDGFTDDASIAESFGEEINLIQGDELNIKVTHPSDLLYAESALLYRSKI
ncbi:MAG: 2-C-methyl-D-erythritol 4-phosphate cytidylyltransferase [Sphingobacteriales bacterium]|jgi:2-C-methyl-D-erythritol 4-phosphate cytidylyltransferase